MRKYISAKRIPRRKPTTTANRKLAAELRRIIRNRRTKKADRLSALDRLNLIAPPLLKEIAFG